MTPPGILAANPECETVVTADSESVGIKEYVTMQQLRDFAQDNYDLIGHVVIGLGNLGLTVAKVVIDLGAPLLQPFFT